MTVPLKVVPLFLEAFWRPADSNTPSLYQPSPRGASVFCITRLVPPVRRCARDDLSKPPDFRLRSIA